MHCLPGLSPDFVSTRRRSCWSRPSSHLAGYKASSCCATKAVSRPTGIQHMCSVDRMGHPASAPIGAEQCPSQVEQLSDVNLAVAYVKYDRASSAAAAQEHLHETVLSDGRTKLKVMLAEAPHSRQAQLDIAQQLTCLMCKTARICHWSCITACAFWCSAEQSRCDMMLLVAGVGLRTGRTATWRWPRTPTTSRRAPACSSSSPRTPTRASSRCRNSAMFCIRPGHAQVMPHTLHVISQKNTEVFEDVLERSLLFCLENSTDLPDAQEELARWPELQYCKTDLIASKGVVFCKFSQSSSALRALEAIAETSMVRCISPRRFCGTPEPVVCCTQDVARNCSLCLQ